MTEILHFWSDLSLVKMDHGGSSYVFSGAIQGTIHSACIFRDNTNIRVQFAVSSEL